MPKISELTTVASPLSTDTIPLVEAGVTKRATLASLPLSDAEVTALALKAPLASPTFTGTPALGAATATTAASNDSSTKVATTAFVNPAGSLAAAGYQKLASGLILQWATVSASTAGVAIVFPIAFPTACLSITGTTAGDSAATSITIAFHTLTTTGTTAYSASSTPAVRYIAIGY
jgi:hypothetical protein